MQQHRYIVKINSLLKNTNTYEISNLITINKDITLFNNLIKNQKLELPHWTPPYNPHIIFAYSKSINQTPLHDPLFLALVVLPTK